MKTRASFLLWCLLLLTPLWAGASSNCTDWFLVTVDSRTGEVLHRKYLYTTCEDCFDMCLEQNDGGGGSGNNDFELFRFVNHQEECSETYLFRHVSQLYCELDIVGDVPWIGPSYWVPKVLKANEPNAFCKLYNMTFQIVDTGSKASANESLNSLGVIFSGQSRYVLGGNVFGKTLGLDLLIEEIYHSKYYMGVWDGCFKDLI